MRFDVLTLFPQIFDLLPQYSIIERALFREIISLRVHNLRDYTSDNHRTTDDYPFGGGPGMVMLAEPILLALTKVHSEAVSPVHTILLGPAGLTFTQQKAQELARKQEICFVCGHYEGVDARVKSVVDEQISLGDFVTIGGELPAMVIIDAVTRLLPDVLGNPDSLSEESFQGGSLEHDHYTRPQIIEVPDILLSGHHQRIAEWRLKDSLLRTLLMRPDLLEGRTFSREEKKILIQLRELLNRLLAS